jgi:hypothetical protein
MRTLQIQWCQLFCRLALSAGPRSTVTPSCGHAKVCKVWLGCAIMHSARICLIVILCVWPVRQRAACRCFSVHGGALAGRQCVKSCSSRIVKRTSDSPSRLVLTPRPPPLHGDHSGEADPARGVAGKAIVDSTSTFRSTLASPLCRETIREKLIPHAVSWYTGEAIEQEEFGDEDDDEDDEDDDEDDDDEDDEDDEDEVGQVDGCVPRCVESFSSPQ